MTCSDQHRRRLTGLSEGTVAVDLAATKGPELVIPAGTFVNGTVKGLIDDCIVPVLVGRFIRERLSTRANPLGCDDNGDQS